METKKLKKLKANLHKAMSKPLLISRVILIFGLIIKNEPCDDFIF